MRSPAPIRLLNISLAVMLTVDLLVIAACTLRSAAQVSTPDADAPPSLPITAADAPLIRRAATLGNAFAADMSRVLAASPGNTCWSPHALLVPLTMLSEGISGTGHEQMRAALHLSASDDVRAVALLDHSLNSSARSGDGWSLSTANRLWVHDKRRVLPAFAERTAMFAARTVTVPFASKTEASRAAINQWIGQRTHQRITEAIPPGGITADTELVLTSTIALKAHWEIQDLFRSERTRPEPFSCANGATQAVPMMHAYRPLSAATMDGFTVLRLPFKGQTLELVVLTPDDRAVDAARGLRALEQRFTAANVTAWIAATPPLPTAPLVDLALPRWKHDCSIDGHQALLALGVRDVAQGLQCDRMLDGAPQRLEVTAIHHRAQVTVDETGAEAVAETAVMVFGRGMKSDPPKPLVIRCDRPFLYLIRHITSGAWLFVGRFEKP